MKRYLLGLTCCLAILFSVTASATADVILIAHPDTAPSSMGERDVRDLFLGNRSRIGGVNFIPVLLRDGSTHDAFLSARIGRTAVQFQTHWRNIVFTGRGKALASFDSEAEVVEFVAENRGAIGYISAGTSHDNVKVIAVD
jgi:hypothetical protein